MSKLPMLLKTITSLIEMFERGTIEVVYDGDPNNIYNTGYPVVKLCDCTPDSKVLFLATYFEDCGDWDYIERLQCVTNSQVATYNDLPSVLHNQLDNLIKQQLFPPTEEELQAQRKATEQALTSMSRPLLKSFIEPSPFMEYLKRRGIVKPF